jgi:hypothetical protein
MSLLHVPVKPAGSTFGMDVVAVIPIVSSLSSCEVPPSVLPDISPTRGEITVWIAPVSQ